jgi:diguanylate cyclase (GGDEF)-like protein
MVFSKSFIQIMLSISILLTLAVVWLIKPEAVLTIDSVDHVVRLGMFMIAIWFAWFVRRVFQSKLIENAEQIHSQQIITEISSDFVSMSGRNLDDKIGTALSKTGALLKMDRCYIYLFDERRENLICRRSWPDRDEAADSSIQRTIGSSSFPGITACVGAGQPLVISDVSDAACDTYDELPRLLGSHDKSFAAMPVIIKNEVYGFFGMDADRKTKKWPETQVAFIKIIANILADAFEKIQRENEITEMAFYDYLTKLPNRILFKERVTEAIAAAEGMERTLAVAFLSFDAFKAVNDSVGHDGGDALLIKAAEKLSELLREQDVLSRFGGDGFLVLLDSLNSPNEIPKIIENMLSVFDKPFVISGQEFFNSVSAGIAVWPHDGADPEALIKNADIAMFKAKEQGKNGYLFCNTDMKEEIFQKIKLRSSLFRALERHEFCIYYQPQVDTRSKTVIGAEVLIRWLHSEDGMIAPGLFIPLAEQTGLIGPIGDWVLMTACLQCKTWQLSGLPEVRIGVNVSVLQLRNPEFVYRVGQILEETQLLPQYLELEVTESVTVGEAGYIIEVLNKLKMLGVAVSIDDFGTEYSSLSRLTTMPIDRIKLDMQFISGIGQGKKEEAIIKGIISLAHNLGLSVIAEGVETKMQLDFLTEHRCDEIQGFYFSRPIPPEQFEVFLREF